MSDYFTYATGSKETNVRGVNFNTYGIVVFPDAISAETAARESNDSSGSKNLDVVILDITPLSKWVLFPKRN